LGIGYFPTRSLNPTSESLESIHSARSEYNLRAALREHDRSRFADSAACAGDDDDFVFHIVFHGVKYLTIQKTTTYLRRVRCIV
jgi:hypothetical protein